MKIKSGYFFYTSWQRLLLIFVLSLMVGCQSSPKQSSHEMVIPPASPLIEETTFQDELQTMMLLYQQHEAWRGTPYRIGGNSLEGIDCSGFVQITFRDMFGINLPRTTNQQLHSGQRISRADLKPGDLVFFRDGRHVGIYLEGHKFLHASTTRGVMVSSLKNTYWSRHFWQAISIRH